MWNYVYLIAYLNWKDPTEFTGIETYVVDKLSDNDSGW